MDVNPCLLAGEEKQSKLAVADDGWCHVWTVADGGMAARGSAASWLFSSRRKALILLAHHMACFAMPNVKANWTATAGALGPVAENVQRTCQRAKRDCRRGSS